MKLNDCKPLFSSVWRIARGRYLPTLAMALLLMILAGPTLAAGDDDRIAISGAIGEETLIAQLQSRGLVPPAGSDLTLKDYVYNNAGKARLNAAVGVWLGPKGHMVPSPEWQRMHKTYCKQRARSPRAATQLLAFDMTRSREKAGGKDRFQYYVFAKLIDWKSHKIQKEYEGDSSVMQPDNSKSGVTNNPDAAGLPPAMDAAWDGLGVNIGAPVSPCGEIRLQHISGSQANKPVTFRAGFQGSYGRYLKYSWTFGDGSEAQDISKNASHEYAKKGTYAVTVRVEGKNIQPGSKTISVVIGEIQPRDGTWNIKLTGERMLGCSPRIASAAKSGLTKMVGENHEHTITFAKPFHPKPLMEHDATLHWEHTGSNQWKTELSRQGSKAMSMRMVLDVEVISETRINEVGTYHLDVSPMFVKMMGGTAHCRAIGDYELTWLR